MVTRNVPCWWLVRGAPLTGEIDALVAPFRCREDAEGFAGRLVDPAYFVVGGTADSVMHPTIAPMGEG